MQRLLIASAAASLACSGGEPGANAAGGGTGGTMIIASFAEPGALLPQTMVSTAERQIVEQIFEHLADIRADLRTTTDSGWIPRLADSWTWSADSLSIGFHLNPKARWHDGRPVRAEDVKFSLELYKDPAVASFVAPTLNGIDSISVADSLTPVVWYARRSPEQFFQIAYNLTVVPWHLLKDADRTNLRSSEFAKHPVGSGAFRFATWSPRQSIELVADTNYYGPRARLDRVLWVLSQDPASAATRVLSGEADLIEFTPLDLMSQVKPTSGVRVLRYRNLNYGSLVFNLQDSRNRARPHPLFGDRALRVALSKAMDRDAMRKNIFDSLAVVALGPFTRYYATADTTIRQVEYDSAGAAHMLDSLGWRDTNGDGIRERHGAPLRFSLMVPTSSGTRRRYAVLIQAQLKRVGAQVNIEELDYSAMQPRMFSGRFDALLNAWSSDPSPSAIRQSWHTGTADNGNFGGYGNPAVDAVMDSAIAEFDAARAKALYRRTYQMMVDDAPGVWLYEARNPALLNTRIHAVVDGGDLWWRDMRLWWIPAGERIARDKLGL